MRTTKLQLLTVLLAGILPAVFAGSLHEAAGQNDIAEVRRLLASGADVNSQDASGWTPLFHAASNGNNEVAGMLLSAGTKIDERNKNGGTALFWAARCGHADTVRFLLDKKADIHARTLQGFTALHVAALDGKTEAVQTLLDRGADIEAKATEFGWTPLMMAAEHGHQETVKLLLNRGAKVDAKASQGQTALWIAAFHGRTGAVKILLDRGADIEAKVKNGCTTLMIAAYNGHEETVISLLQYGADISAKNKEGWPVSASATHGKIDLSHAQDAALQNARSRIEYFLRMTMYDYRALTEALITAETTQLPDWLATATVQQKVALLTDVKKQLSRATAAIDRLNGEAADAIVKKQDAAPYRARVGQIKAYINVLNEIKAILEQS